MTIEFSHDMVPIKHCPICKLHTPWHKLKLLGYQPDETVDGKPCWLELRNCACGGTFALQCMERKHG